MYYYPIIIIFIVSLFILLINICSQSHFLLFKKSPRIAIANMMRKPIDLPLWLKHHRLMGVQLFFIRLEDSPGWEDFLKIQPDVVYELGESDPSGNNYLTQQHRQIDFVNRSLQLCKQKNIDWLFHIDGDELLNGSFKFLETLPSHFKCLHFENAEALFDENEKHCFSAKTFLRCSLHAPCRSYANGKGAGRVTDNVSLVGCHHFAYNDEYEGEHVYNVPFDTLHVLHFDSCSIGTWIEKFYHMSKKSNSDIPFPYYKNSLELATKNYETYKNHTHSQIANNLEPHLVYKYSKPLL